MATYSSLPHLNGNLLCAVDVETTGTNPRYHEIVQIAVVPLNSELKLLEGVTPFYTNIKPEYVERADPRAGSVHGLDMEQLVLYAPTKDRVADRFVEWFEKLRLPVGKAIVPMAHNWAFEAGFSREWLGYALFEKLFWGHPRDGMILALAINDRAAFRGESPPFAKVGLGSLCAKFGIPHENAHDAYHDCVAEAEVYRHLLQYEI